jgi:transcription elongation factor Elf1
MAGARHLVCPNSCPGGAFELLGGRVLVDSAGSCLRHETEVATFACAMCGAVAVDLAAAARALRRGAPAPLGEELTCPGCGVTLLAPSGVDAELELQCPDCGLVFAPDEGRARLLGSSTPEDYDEPG